MNHNSKIDLTSEKIVFGRTEDQVIVVSLSGLMIDNYYSKLRAYVLIIISDGDQQLNEKHR